MRLLYLAGLMYIALSLFALMRGPMGALPHAGSTVFAAPTHSGAPSNGAEWFARVKSSCNALEVELLHRQQPPPSVPDAAGFSAACWALGGRIADARTAILELPSDEQWRAAGIVFEIGHPIADMGDDLSAGPIMELVVEFWPNHYMALYHAGAARFSLGEYALADKHLKEFLKHYEMNDGWTSSARSMLDRIAAP